MSKFLIHFDRFLTYFLTSFLQPVRKLFWSRLSKRAYLHANFWVKCPMKIQQVKEAGLKIVKNRIQNLTSLPVLVLATAFIKELKHARF